MLLTSALMMMSCQSQRIKISSEPEGAVVSIFDSETKAYKRSGVTPFVLDESESVLPISMITSDVLGLSIEKPGFVSEHIFIDQSTNPKVEINLKLKPVADWISADDDISSDIAEAVAKNILTVSRLIDQKEFDKALTEVNELVRRYPKAYTFYDLKGSLHLLKGENDAAKENYKKSLKIFPKNIATENALKRIEEKMR